MQRLLREFAYYGRVAKELIFPRRCAVCATNIDNGYVCEQCRSCLLYTSDAADE